MNGLTDELHARPTIYFDGPAYIEHVALMPDRLPASWAAHTTFDIGGERHDWPHTRVEFHTEFVTVTKIRKLTNDLTSWPRSDLPIAAAEDLAGVGRSKLICRSAIVVQSPVKKVSEVIRDFGFGNVTASVVGEGGAQVCSDFQASGEYTSRILLLNADLNKFRLGRMVRQLFEIETYRAMALLGLPEAWRLGPILSQYDAMLVDLSNRHVTTPATKHRELLEEISALSARVISAAAETRNRFSATSAYARIVEDRISELRERRVPEFQRYGMFITRGFQPAVRTCEATSHRLMQLSAATSHLLDLLQTRIQVEIEFQNARQIQAVADRSAAQLKIQRAVEGFSIIAISYYLLSLMRFAVETLDQAGLHVSNMVTLGAIPVVIVSVAISISRVKRALARTD